MKMKKILATLLAVTMLTAALAGCSSREEPTDDPSESSSTAEREEQPPSDETVSSVLPDSKVNVKQLKEENEDTVGWLSVPNTEINDVVLHYADDVNAFYERRNFNKEHDFNGVYYADFRNTFDDPSRDGLNTSITIYGHAMTDDPEKETYEIRFGHLHDFRDEEFAREVPYFFFSTEEENFAYEIIAIFVANVNNPELPYNAPAESGAQYVEMIEEWVFPRSYYDYGVTLSEDDKFMNLSACIYVLEDGTDLGYPNDLRYVIMGRLVEDDAPLKTEADFTINEDMIFDPNGAWKQ